MNSKTITDPIHKNVPFAEYLFGPLPKVYCIYFEILTILTFFVLLLFLFIFIFSLFDYSPKSKGFSFVSFLVVILYSLIYLNNRLLNTMSKKSFK